MGAAVLARAEGEPAEVRVPAEAAWTDTGLELSAGEAFQIEASGRARVLRSSWREWFFGIDYEPVVGPEGTYLWPYDPITRRVRFDGAACPLPSGAAGPAPAFGLIGKVGADGAPFYVGRRFDGAADRAGRLWLGINDGDRAGNRGAFTARIERPSISLGTPSSPAPTVLPGSSGAPVPQARVLLVYVDGLRPDVLREMAEAGFLPNLKRAFLDGGLDCANAFTTFPSNTLTANGALFTGLFPDRTAIKSQNQFERSALIPGRRKTGWRPAQRGPSYAVYDLLDKFSPEATDQFLRRRQIKTLAARLGSAYRFTVLPIVPVNPPTQWLHRAVNTIRNPFAAVVRIPVELDEINARYAIEELLGDPEARVIAVWLPLVDKVSHASPRGQFGTARRHLALVDRSLGKILMRLRQVHGEQDTYLILVSDHGHAGGETRPNRRCHLARELFNERFGCRVQVVGQLWDYPGSDRERFIFIDHQAFAQAAIYLPKGSYARGPWAPNTLGELMRYDLGPNRGVVNLPEALLAFKGREWEAGWPNPVDLVLIRLDARRVLVMRSPENQAIIHRAFGADGRAAYRYEPVRRVGQDPDGRIVAEPATVGMDPLGYLQDAALERAMGSVSAVGRWLADWHGEREWLRVTARSEYPDAVVAVARFFDWQPPVDDLALACTPDLVVTASRGWSFRSDEETGSDHGSLLPESMRISLFVAGPNIRHGVWPQPQRIVDVLPTVLEMIGEPYDPNALDGEAIRGIYE